MALIECPECGRENVSDSAEVCPNCGYAIKAHFDRIAEEEVKKKIHEYDVNEKIKEIEAPQEPTKGIGFIIFSFIILFLMRKKIMLLLLGGWWGLRGKDMIIFILGTFAFLFFIWMGVSSYKDYDKDMKKYKDDLELYKKDKEFYLRREAEKKVTEFENELESWRMKEARKPKCPNCDSTNIVKISTANRAVSVATTGLASGKIGKQYKCKDCKHMW